MIVTENDLNGLRSKELEVEQVLNEINRIFGKYPLDTFYQNIKPLSDFLFFSYYQKCGNQIRANHYHERSLEYMEDLSQMHFMSFHVTRFMESKLDKFLADGNLDSLIRFNEKYVPFLDIDLNESYQFVTWKKYQAACKFYQRDHTGAAKTMNELRNQVNLKNFAKTDVECKLFQALQYCMVGEDSLCTQIISSLKRQIKETDQHYETSGLIIKMIKTAMKPADFRKKVKKITDLWNEFREINSGNGRILGFLNLDEAALRKMANPIKD